MPTLTSARDYFARGVLVNAVAEPVESATRLPWHAEPRAHTLCATRLGCSKALHRVRSASAAQVPRAVLPFGHVPRSAILCHPAPHPFQVDTGWVTDNAPGGRGAQATTGRARLLYQVAPKEEGCKEDNQ